MDNSKSQPLEGHFHSQRRLTERPFLAQGIFLFDSLREAQSATRDLITAGYSRDDMGLLASDATGEWSRYKASTVEGGARMSTLCPNSGEMGSGVGTGTVVGGLSGLLVGLTELAIPDIGWV